jgi:hypothetical protein
LFDYTEVASHYAGAQTFLNPRVFQQLHLPPPTVDPMSRLIGTNELHPPFNRISNFRDPGRININTIFDPVVYNGLMNEHRGPTYSEWFDSRRGYRGASQLSFDPDKPTFFSNPLRPSGSGDIVPFITPTIQSPNGLERSDVDVSLFRKNPRGPDGQWGQAGRDDDNNGVIDDFSEFGWAGSDDRSQPLFESDYTDTPRDANRNPSFKYQSLQRLGNLVTGRSNVYSVWITVGYFEVKAVGNPTPTRPDGYQLGAEVGIDRGQIKRHRAFYMIDRSIPVAFEPGENHNVDKAVILRRYVD